MKGHPYKWKDVMTNLSLYKRYSPNEVLKILEPIHLTSRYAQKKVDSFITGLDTHRISGRKIADFYHSVIGWKRPESLLRSTHIRIGKVMDTLKKYPDYGVYVSSPEGHYFLCSPRLIRKINSPLTLLRHHVVSKIINKLENLEDRCSNDTFFKITNLIHKNYDYDYLAPDFEVYKKRFNGDFTPTPLVVLNDGKKPVLFFNKEFYDIVFKGNTEIVFVNPPEPAKDYKTSDLLKEAASYVKPKERKLTKEEEVELSSKFLTSYKELGKIESEFGLSAHAITKLADLMSKENYESFSVGKEVFSKKELLEILPRISDLENLTNHYMSVAVYHNSGLISNQVKHYLPFAKSMEFNDLYNEGVLGFMRGFKKFDPSKGYKFGTYITWWIKQAIQKALIRNDGFFSRPVHINDMCLKVNKVIIDFTKENERVPTEEELAEEVGVPVNTIKLILETMKLSDVLSLNNLLYDEGDEDLETRVVYDKDINPEEYMISKVAMNANSKFFSNLFSKLKPREKKILRMRFGIGYDQNYTLEEVGKKCGDLTRERIRQIEEEALEKLREQNRNIKPEDYF